MLTQAGVFPCFLPAGPASVIIALTDGELQEDQLISAQQEVAASHSVFRCSGRDESILLFLSHRQRKPDLWEPSFTVLVSKTLMKHR